MPTVLGIVICDDSILASYLSSYQYLAALDIDHRWPGIGIE